MLDVFGNLFGRILQDRLKKVLPESHCGFCRGRGCVDMIFAARQLFEKSRERDESLFALFIDLLKAYGLVSSDVLWQVLKKYVTGPAKIDHVSAKKSPIFSVFAVS